MKKVTILFIALCTSVFIYAQDINYAEYFIDSDPGFGMATPIAVTETGADVSMDFSADLALVSEGMHYLVIRARDDLGRWSQGANRIFYHVKAMDISDRIVDRAEYFIDTDPGFGKGVSIPVTTPGHDLTLHLNPDIQDLDQGMHYIHFRARDVSGRWGTVVNSIFLIVKLPSSMVSNIQLVEYFIDTDPGYGNGTRVTLPSAGTDLDIDFDVSLSGLSDGNHVLYIRAKNEFNQWGQVYAEGFAYNSTGVDQEEVHSIFKIYPNPSIGKLQIEFPDQEKPPFMIRMTNLQGKLVYEGELRDNPCEVNLKLPAGMYILTIDSGESCITQKIILE
jgi:hypothetical protein